MDKVEREVDRNGIHKPNGYNTDSKNGIYAGDIVLYPCLKLYDNTTKRAEIIYNVSYNKSGYPMFLIYNDGQWIRKSAKYFSPIR